MRFHVVGLPHTQTTSKYLVCAYTAKVINFCKMMKDRGHEVFLYSGEQNEAECTEHVQVVEEQARARFVGERHYTEAPFEYRGDFWQSALARTIAEIAIRRQKGDFLCLIGGLAQKQIADAFPEMLAVEFGVGYGGIFAKYRVFESYAWMHTVYGARSGGDAHAVDGNWWDVVIPGYVDERLFPAGSGGDYLLYVGRLIERKGWRIAVEVAQAVGLPLKIAGPGAGVELPSGVEYLGVVGPRERSELMGGARALLCPTIYVEPFANVHVEAMMCGTPVIATDWGVFTETVDEGETGFRCRMFREFVRAAKFAGELDREAIRQRAMARFSLAKVAVRYEQYFERLASLWEKGWYQE